MGIADMTPFIPGQYLAFDFKTRGCPHFFFDKPSFQAQPAFHQPNQPNQQDQIPRLPSHTAHRDEDTAPPFRFHAIDRIKSAILYSYREKTGIPAGAPRPLVRITGILLVEKHGAQHKVGFLTP
jgi:hypothetical protein